MAETDSTVIDLADRLDRLAEDSKKRPGKTKPKTPRGDSFTVNDSGVWHQEDDGSKVWVCSRLTVTALTHDVHSSLWGYLLEWADHAGVVHVWPMPAELLKGSGEEYRGALLSDGLRIAPGAKARNLLSHYIQTRNPGLLAICTDRIGWHDGSFVLPDQVIGNPAERLLFQALTRSSVTFSVRGTLFEWRDQVAALCQGNSRLTLAVCMGFTAPVLALTGDENGGVHLVGASSTGKTTALRLAASVFGGKDYLQRWRATDNGLEAVAAAANDALLVLDEIGQVDGRRAGEMAYMLANGSGKHRANRLGLARPAAAWRLMFLSSGETGLADLMQESGRRAKAGQEIRLLDLPADVEQGNGIFECLHNFPSPSALADHLVAAAGQCYGTAGPAFITGLIEHRDALPALLTAQRERIKAAMLSGYPESSGQTERAAGRLALIGAAGELATLWGITGWEPGTAAAAAVTCFKAWLARRGGAGDLEQQQVLRQARLFFELYGESRFVHWHNSGEPDQRTIINRAGAVKFDGDEPVFFVLQEVFRAEICKGFDFRLATRVLRKAGILEPDKEGKSSQNQRLPDMGMARCYVCRPFRILKSNEKQV